MPPVQDFGGRLRRVRRLYKKEQIDLAPAGATAIQRKKFGAYISKLENGHEDNPSLDKLEQISKGLGLTLTDFFAQIERSQTKADLKTGGGSVIVKATRGTTPSVPEHNQQFADLARACLEAVP